MGPWVLLGFSLLLGNSQWISWEWLWDTVTIFLKMFFPTNQEDGKFLSHPSSLKISVIQPLRTQLMIQSQKSDLEVFNGAKISKMKTKTINIKIKEFDLMKFCCYPLCVIFLHQIKFPVNHEETPNCDKYVSDGN